jgi:hypothetical protein
MVSLSSKHESIFIVFFHHRKALFVLRLADGEGYLSFVTIATIAPRASAWRPVSTPVRKVHAK